VALVAAAGAGRGVNVEIGAEVGGAAHLALALVRWFFGGRHGRG